MINNFMSEEALQEIVDRLLPLYPDNAVEATRILLEEYELPVQVAYLVMTLVHVKKAKANVLNWPLFDAQQRHFGLN